MKARAGFGAKKRMADRAMNAATELSQELHGSKPKIVPGGFRWSETNESVYFTTYSPEYGQKVVVVVSAFENGEFTLNFFSDEGLSETARYANIGHFGYNREYTGPMKRDIEWVWKTVDAYAASWDEGGVEEVRVRESKHRPSMTYGTLPSFEAFIRHIRSDIDPETDEPYWPEGTDFPMELVDSDEIDLVEQFGELRPFTPGRFPHKSGYRGDERQIYDLLEFLVQQWNEGNEEGGDFASSIMYVLGYEWI